MNNKFSTEISYEKPSPGARHAGSVIISSDVGALLRALAFMGLWLVLTVLLLAEPLMLNLKTGQAKLEPIIFSHGDVQPPLPTPAPPHQLELRHAPSSVEGKLNATPLPENQPARLSYAVLTLK